MYFQTILITCIYHWVFCYAKHVQGILLLLIYYFVFFPIRILQNSQLFSRHPDLLRLTGVHLTVMNVVKSYLSFNTSLKSKNDHKIRVRIERKKKITFAGVSYHDFNILSPQTLKTVNFIHTCSFFNV